jgi:methyltransferase (TIGR00027 family)
MELGPNAIAHVSDTALMTAACRAIETDRPDGLTRDPFAARLAGSRGMAIVHDMPDRERMCFGMGVRTRFLDDLLLETVAEQNIETVLNLGSGLDTRPWRLSLPATLRWIETDLPPMLAYKTKLMAGEQPHCRLEFAPVDVTDPAAREAIFLAAGTAPLLVISEGLLMYLPAESVEALAAQASAAHHWLVDIISPTMAARGSTHNWQSIQNVRAETHLNGLEILEVLRRHNWQSAKHRNFGRDAWPFAAERINQLLRDRADSTKVPPPLPPDDPSGIHLFAR